MKKLSALLVTAQLLVTLLFPVVSFAQSQRGPVDIRIGTPNQGIAPNTTPGTVLTNILTIVFVIAALVVLFFIISGAFQWITSGGDKEKVGKARGAILNAIIGLALLALAFLIARVAAQIVNVDLLNLSIPTLDTPNSATQ